MNDCIDIPGWMNLLNRTPPVVSMKNSESFFSKGVLPPGFPAKTANLRLHTPGLRSFSKRIIFSIIMRAPSSVRAGNRPNAI